MAQTDIPKPTQRQHAYLRALARRTGTSFTYPSTEAEASREIQRLKAIRSGGFSFAEIQAKDHADPRGGLSLTDGAAIRPDEIEGYGSNARWSHQMQ
jgi:hypothetical protein